MNIKILEKVGIILYFVSKLVAQKRIYAVLCVLCMGRLYLNCRQLVTATAASSRKVSHDGSKHEYFPQTEKTTKQQVFGPKVL